MPVRSNFSAAPYPILELKTSYAFGKGGFPGGDREAAA